MKVIDPGHEYELDSLDGEQPNRLVFVKREGDKYPGNVGHHPGTNCQEVMRALIERLRYVNEQISCRETTIAINKLEDALDALYVLEQRAAVRHGRGAAFDRLDRRAVVEGRGKCRACGHVGCGGDCHQEGKA